MEERMKESERLFPFGMSQEPKVPFIGFKKNGQLRWVKIGINGKFNIATLVIIILPLEYGSCFLKFLIKTL